MMTIQFSYTMSDVFFNIDLTSMKIYLFIVFILLFSYLLQISNSYITIKVNLTIKKTVSYILNDLKA